MSTNDHLLSLDFAYDYQILFTKLQILHKLHYNSNVKLTPTSKYDEKSPLPNIIMYEELTLQLHIFSHEDIHIHH